MVTRAGYSKADLRVQMFREYGVHVKVDDDTTLDLLSATPDETRAIFASNRATCIGMNLKWRESCSDKIV